MIAPTEDNQKLSKHLVRRYSLTLDFVKKNVAAPARMLDLGVQNRFSEILIQNGYQVSNTKGENLDNDFSAVQNPDIEVVTAFEIFEHMMAPYNVLKNIKARRMVITVPLKLWFASAYWSETDPWDCHYHEFESKQLDHLLKRTGWVIKDSAKWTAPTGVVGFRPILRSFVPRYYAVYCEKA